MDKTTLIAASVPVLILLVIIVYVVYTVYNRHRIF